MEKTANNELDRTLQQVAHKLGEIQARNDEHLRATKGRFNLFTVLLSEGDETRLHSRYLAHLLHPNPAPNHDCGPLFLKLFVTTLVRCGVQPPDGASREHLGSWKDVNFDNTRVHREIVVPDGRMDILIEFPGQTAIAIENKIWAAETNKQLETYSTYLKTKYPKKHLLLYLTPEGKASATANGHEYFRISYREHIMKWLEECLRATYQYVNINQALQQYKNVVCKVAKLPTLETKFMSQTIEVVQKNPDILKFLPELNSAADVLREEYRNSLLNEMKRQLHSKGFHLEEIVLFGGRGRQDWIISKPPIPKCVFGKTPINILITAGSWEGGLRIINGVFDEPHTPEMTNFFKMVQQATKEESYSDKDGWNGGFYEPADGDCLTNEKLAKLVEFPNRTTETVERWVRRIAQYFDTVVDVCNASNNPRPVSNSHDSSI